ncbi:MAG: UDP-galactopyranose mutase [Bacillota bacterium]
MVIKNIVVGAGFAGSIMARLIAEEKGEEVLVVEKRNHIGGNAFDFYNEDGILVHKYGPHIFHTNSKSVWDYLSRFTKWRLYQHKVQAFIDGQKVPIPINIDTINKLYGTCYNADNIEAFYNSIRVSRDSIENSEDMVISKIGTELYTKFYKHYTKKQWDLYPNELDPEVTARIPVRPNRDNRYFSDMYQGIPKHGYTRMFENILDHPGIHVLLNTDFQKTKDHFNCEKIIYTGCIDEFFGFKFGKLPYRSLDFEFETLEQKEFQEVGTVNFPNDYDFTRITEFKHLTGQKSCKTTIMREYPCADGEPYYPIPKKENNELYKKYITETRKLEGVYFCGRLGSYQYYNMDKVVENSMQLFTLIFKDSSSNRRAIKPYNKTINF